MNDDPKASISEVHAAVQSATVEDAATLHLQGRIEHLQAQVDDIRIMLSALRDVVEAKVDVSALDAVQSDISSLDVSVDLISSRLDDASGDIAKNLNAVNGLRPLEDD